jgi:Glycosyl transferase family 2
MRTVLTHFYNEEYLLPWWLSHHRKIFDHGILVDYDSTDRSCEIIREMCPTWEIVTSRNRTFHAPTIDHEIQDIERQLSGWRICLNITEFLYGDYNLMSADEPVQLLIPSHICVDPLWDRAYDPDVDLIRQCKHGLDFRYNGEKLPLVCMRWGMASAFSIRMARSAHNHAIRYDFVGRHWHSMNTEDLVIFWHGWSPMNHHIIRRKAQIKDRIPPGDFANNWGNQHNVTPELLMEQWKNLWCHVSEDMTQEFDRLLALHDQSLDKYGKVNGALCVLNG